MLHRPLKISVDGFVLCVSSCKVGLTPSFKYTLILCAYFCDVNISDKYFDYKKKQYIALKWAYISR